MNVEPRETCEIVNIRNLSIDDRDEIIKFENVLGKLKILSKLIDEDEGNLMGGKIFKLAKIN